LDVNVPIEKSPDDSKDNDTDDKNDTKPDTDTDNDDLPDWWEEKYFGNLTYGKNDDVDGDKYTNFKEYQAETDPTKKTDRPFSDTDTIGEDDDRYTEITDPFSTYYLIGILALIVIIIILLFFLFVIRKQRYDDQVVLAGTSAASMGIGGDGEGVRWGEDHEDTDKHFCPDCEEQIYEDDLECPLCGLDLEDYDFEEDDEYDANFDDFDYHGRPRVGSRRKFYKRSSKMSTRGGRGTRRDMGRSEYGDYDEEEYGIDEEDYMDEDEYYEDDEEEYDEYGEDDEKDHDEYYEDEEEEYEDEYDEEEDEYYEEEDEEYEDEYDEDEDDEEEYITEWH
jgi:hypothetical protein